MGIVNTSALAEYSSGIHFLPILLNISAALLPISKQNFHSGEGIAEVEKTWFDTTTAASMEKTCNDSCNEDDHMKSSQLKNWWNVFDEQYLRHSLAWTTTLLAAYTIILILGVIGNFMVILVVVLRPQMRTVTNMFIMNLAVADLFVVVFCVPATFMANVFKPWILGSVMCKGVAYVQGVSVCASAFSLVAISFDRCKAIYRPLERSRGLSKTQAFSTICLIWIIALLVTLPWAVIFNVVTSPYDGLSYCVETWENESYGRIYFLVVNLFCCYGLPLVLISLSNIIIWCHVSHRKVPEDSSSVSDIKRIHRQTRHGVRKMLGIVTLTFLLSWLPLYALVIRFKFSSNIDDTEASIILDILMPCAQWLGSWNSSINPILYAFLNSRFREMFKSILPRWMPFHKKTRRLQRNGTGPGAVTNVTIIIGGNKKGPNYTTVITASSPCNRKNSRCFFRHRNNNQHNAEWNKRSILKRDSNTVTTTVILPTKATYNTPFFPLYRASGSCGECSTEIGRSAIPTGANCYTATSINTITEL